MLSKIYSLTEPKKFEVLWQNIDLIEKGAVLVRPKYLSICAADRRYFGGMRERSILEKKLPLALIHEGVGIVVNDASGELEKGTEVVFVPNIDAQNDISERVKSNYDPNSCFLSSDADGFTQEYLVLPKKNLIEIPRNEKNMRIYSLTEPLSVVINAIETLPKCSINKNTIFAIWGDGIMGYLLACALEHLYKDTKICVIGKHKRKLDLFYFIDEKYYVDDLPSDFYADIAFECVGGKASESAIEQIVNCVSPQGKISLLGVSESPVLLPTRMVLEKGLNIVGASRSNIEDFKKAVDMMNSSSRMKEYLECAITSQMQIKDEQDLKKAFERSMNSDFKVVMEWNV